MEGGKGGVLSQSIIATPSEGWEIFFFGGGKEEAGKRWWKLGKLKLHLFFIHFSLFFFCAPKAQEKGSLGGAANGAAVPRHISATASFEFAVTSSRRATPSSVRYTTARVPA